MNQTDKFKLKIIELKDKLPRDYLKIIFQKYPKYDNRKYYDLIRNVVNLRQVDEEVYQLLKEICNDKVVDTQVEAKTPRNKENNINYQQIINFK